MENLEFVPYLKMLFPQARFVHVIRNPYANMVALRKFKTHSSFPSIPELLKTIRLSFYYHKLNSRQIADYYTLRFEDLLMDPVAEVKRLCTAIGIQYSDSCLIPTRFGIPWKGNTTSGEKFSGIDSRPVSAWEKDVTGVELELVRRAFGNRLVEYGYADPELHRPFFKIEKGESLRTYLRNRLFKYYADL